MTCDRCGARCQTIDSRTNALGVRRRRKCACGHRFSTQELPVETLHILQSLDAHKIQQLICMVDGLKGETDQLKVWMTEFENARHAKQGLAVPT